MCRTKLSFATIFSSVTINHCTYSVRTWSQILPFPPPRRAPPICFLSFGDHYPSSPESQCLHNCCFTHTFCCYLCVCVCLRKQAKTSLVIFISRRSAIPQPACLYPARGIISLFSGWEKPPEVPGRRASPPLNHDAASWWKGMCFSCLYKRNFNVIFNIAQYLAVIIFINADRSYDHSYADLYFLEPTVASN